MNEFNIGDKVVAKRYKDYLQTATQNWYFYVADMVDIANSQYVMEVTSVNVGASVLAGSYHWRAEDLEHANLNLENE